MRFLFFSKLNKISSIITLAAIIFSYSHWPENVSIHSFLLNLEYSNWADRPRLCTPSFFYDCTLHSVQTIDTPRHLSLSINLQPTHQQSILPAIMATMKITEKVMMIKLRNNVWLRRLCPAFLIIAILVTIISKFSQFENYHQNHLLWPFILYSHEIRQFQHGKFTLKRAGKSKL